MLLATFLSRFKFSRSEFLVIVVVTILLIPIYVLRKTLRYTRYYDEEQDIDEDLWNILTFNHKGKTEASSDILRSIIDNLNGQETIYNEDIFGPITQETVVLVICAQKLTMHFRLLLASLSNVRGIENALIVVSHSYIEDEMNLLVRRLKLCKIIQIYFPFSIQAYQKEFPGFSSKDCPTNMKIGRALTVNCTGSSNPDIHGKFRQPSKSELKHHWWWTANKVFDDMKCLKGYTGPVVFIEEDFYVTEDFLYMLLFIQKTCDETTVCDVISLSEPSTNYKFESERARGVEVTTWNPKLHSGVLAFNTYTWFSLVSHYDKFCTYDDFSWAHSLLYVSLNRQDGYRYKVASPVLPRAYHVSRLASTYAYFENDVVDTLYEMLYFQNRFKGLLFPPFLEYAVNIELDRDDEIVFDYVDMNGGWSDPRDKQLCINITINKFRRIVRDMSKIFKIAYFTGFPSTDFSTEKYGII